VNAPAEIASSLWPLARARALKRKVLTHAEAAAALGIALGDVPNATWPIHAWCWARGLPPLNVVVVARGTAADRDGGFATPDFDVFRETLGYSVYLLEQAWHYPWQKVPDPTPEQLGWALGVHGRLHALVQEFRFLDLELEARLRDEARGRKRPVPAAHPTWAAAEAAHAHALAALAAQGVQAPDLRPPGKGPYPPPRPVIGNWAD
jgi:hypothetical protein